MLFIWFHRIRYFIIAVLIAAVSLLTSVGMSKFSLHSIVSIIEIVLALFYCLNSLIIHILQRTWTARSFLYLIQVLDCRIQTGTCMNYTCADCGEFIVVCSR
jgi:hypothetical protein